MGEPNTLYLACARPAMKWGIPAGAWWLDLEISMFVLIFGKNPIVALIVFWVMYYIFRALARWNRHFFRVLYLWTITRRPNSGARVWGGSSRSATAAGRKRMAEFYSYV